MRAIVGTSRYGKTGCAALLLLAVSVLPVMAQTAGNNNQSTQNSASSFSYRRADLGSGYSTSSILKMPSNSSYFITCNCDDRTLQDLTCPTPSYACTCVPHAYLMCQ
jgi:hypothetical protein